nr:MAG TPA: hypothetical protein [Caudoviricetes sp.]
MDIRLPPMDTSVRRPGTVIVKLLTAYFNQLKH